MQDGGIDAARKSLDHRFGKNIFACDFCERILGQAVPSRRHDCSCASFNASRSRYSLSS